MIMMMMMTFFKAILAWLEYLCKKQTQKEAGLEGTLEVVKDTTQYQRWEQKRKITKQRWSDKMWDRSTDDGAPPNF